MKLTPVLLACALSASTSAYQLPQIPTLSNLACHLPSLPKLPRFLKTLTTDSISASPVLSLHRSLVQIPSVTGEERPVADFLTTYLTSHNFTVESQVVSGDRINLYAYLGTNRTTHTLLTSHIDTVPPFIPYRASHGTIYGRGSNDAKGSVAAMITAVEELLASSTIKEGDVSLLFVVGEEFDGVGMKTANNLGLKWNTVIFGEPTENKLAVGHKGIMLFHVLSSGKASHSGYPQLGINANSQLIQALARLDALELPESDLLGPSTLNIGRIDGGVAVNVIPAHANASVAVRVAGDLDETVNKIKYAVKGVPGIELKFLSQMYGPVELDHEVEGFDTIVCAYGTDVPNLKGDHRKFLYGPGSILTAHGDNEYVLKSDLFDAVNGYKALIKEALWPKKLVPAVVEGEGVFNVGERIEEVKNAVVDKVAEKVAEMERIVVMAPKKAKGRSLKEVEEDL
jgi:acetylornithine deacetylase